MIWNYKLTTNTIWLSFDYGQVEASTEDEARQLAEKVKNTIRVISKS